MDGEFTDREMAKVLVIPETRDSGTLSLGKNIIIGPDELSSIKNWEASVLGNLSCFDDLKPNL